MCSPHSPDLSGIAAFLAASSSAQNTTTRAGATSCPCLHTCHVFGLRALMACNPRVFATNMPRDERERRRVVRQVDEACHSLSEIHTQLPAHDYQLPALVRHNVPGGRHTSADTRCKAIFMHW